MEQGIRYQSRGCVIRRCSPRSRHSRLHLVCPTLCSHLRLRRLGIRFSCITNLCFFPENQHTLGLCLFISWIQLDGFIECPEYLGIFSKIYQCQTFVESRICESGGQYPLPARMRSLHRGIYLYQTPGFLKSIPQIPLSKPP